MKIIPIMVVLLFTLINYTDQVKAQNSSIKTKSTMTVTTEKEAIEKLLLTYQDALNASSVNDVIPLYAKDGQFLPTQAPSAIGPEELKKSYEMVFKTIQLKVTFHIEEIVVSGDLAFARTHSQGTNLIHATRQTTTEENRELFVLQKESNQWKISRYMFNKTK